MLNEPVVVLVTPLLSSIWLSGPCSFKKDEAHTLQGNLLLLYLWQKTETKTTYSSWGIGKCGNAALCISYLLHLCCLFLRNEILLTHLTLVWSLTPSISRRTMREQLIFALLSEVALRAHKLNSIDWFHGLLCCFFSFCKPALTLAHKSCTNILDINLLNSTMTQSLYMLFIAH